MPPPLDPHLTKSSTFLVAEMFKKPLWQTVWTQPDQTGPIGAVCYGSTLFASILNSSVMLGNYLQQTTSAEVIFQMHLFLDALRVKVTTDTNNHNPCMTKHILPYNCNIYYRIYLKLIEINGIGMLGAIMMNLLIYIFQQELLPLIIILPLFYMGKLQYCE